MPIYAKAGESLQYVMTESQARRMPDLILMATERPTSAHIATEKGVWVEAPLSPDYPIGAVDQFVDKCGANEVTWALLKRIGIQ
jgi:hypothetical protein